MTLYQNGSDVILYDSYLPLIVATNNDRKLKMKCGFDKPLRTVLCSAFANRRRYFGSGKSWK